MWHLRLHPAHNIAVVKRPLQAGMTLEGGASNLPVKQFIPGGHKTALEPVAVRQAVRRYGGLAAPIEYSPDGRYVLVGFEDWTGDTGDKTLVLWNVDEYSPSFDSVVWARTDFAYLPRSAAFTSDGARLLVGTSTLDGLGGLSLWDVATGDELLNFPIHELVSGILVRPDNKRVITTHNYSDHLIEWDIDPNSPGFGNEIRRIENRGTIFETAWVPGAASFIDTELTEWDYETGKPIRQLNADIGGAWAIEVSPDGRYVLAGFEPGRIILWDLSEREATLAIHAIIVHGIACLQR